MICVGDHVKRMEGVGLIMTSKTRDRVGLVTRLCRNPEYVLVLWDGRHTADRVWVRYLMMLAR